MHQPSDSLDAASNAQRAEARHEPSRWMQRLAGESAVALIWASVILSILGSSITEFGIAIHIFETTGSVAAMTALTFVAVTPRIYISVFAGVIIDRTGAQKVLAATALAGAVVAMVTASALMMDSLPTWAALLATGASSIASGFRDVALKTVVPAFVVPARLPVVNGRIGSAQTVPYVAGPALAATVLTFAPLHGVLVAEALILTIAAIVVVAVRFPVRDAPAASGPMMARIAEGRDWIVERKPLLWLCVFFGFFLFFSGASTGLVTAYVLAMSGGDKAVLAGVQTMVAIGGLLSGSLAAPLMKRVGPLGTIAVCCGGMCLSRILFGLSTGPVGWGLSNFVRGSGFIVAGAADDTLWHRIVPEAWRGRVFGTRRVMTHGLFPLGIALGGVLGTALSGSEPSKLGSSFVLFGLIEAASLLLLLRVRSSGYARHLEESQTMPPNTEAART